MEALPPQAVKRLARKEKEVREEEGSCVKHSHENFPFCLERPTCKKRERLAISGRGWRNGQASPLEEYSLSPREVAILERRGSDVLLGEICLPSPTSHLRTTSLL